MSDDQPVILEGIPVFTGNLALLDTKVTALTKGGAAIATAAGDVHSSFGGLQAFYKAPEAEQLFATTKPVATTAASLKSDLGTITGALSTYSDDAYPLVEKLKELKRDAGAFLVKVNADDKWREDGDLVEENNTRRDQIRETWTAFQAVERTCHDKIVALVGGPALKIDDGSGKAGMYGYDAEALKHAKGLPWGDPVKESTPAWQVWEHAYDFGKGFFVDGVGATIKGLGTLVGFDGWDAMKQAWTGLAQLSTGLVMTVAAGPAFWMTSDDKLPSWLRDSRTAMKETGKALVAWDQWGENPSRAAGTVTFNAITVVFTRGAGSAVAGAGKAGAATKALSFVSKAGRAVDPMTYIFKGAGAGLSKISDVLAGLKGTGAIEIPPLPDNIFTLPEGAARLPDGTVKLPEGATIPDGAVRLPDGTVKLPEGVVALPEGTVKLPEGQASAPEGTVRPPSETPAYWDRDGNLYKADGSILQRAEDAPTESGGPATTASNPRAETPARVPEMAGVGARGGTNTDGVIRLGDSIDNELGDIGRVGNDSPGGGISNNVPGGVADNLPGGSAGNMPRNELDHGRPGSSPDGSSRADGSGSNAPATGSGGRDVSGGSRPDNGIPGGSSADNSVPARSEASGIGASDDLGRGGDDATRPDSSTPGQSAEVQRPSFMRDGDNPYGPRNALTDEQIIEIQVYRANHEPGYFEDFYKNNGNRKRLELVDESGLTPPQLTRASENHPWNTVKDGPEPIKPDYTGGWEKKKADDVTSPDRLKKLDEAALKRHLAIRHDQLMENWKKETTAAHDLLSNVDTAAHRGESVGAYKESHSVMRDAAEDYGEAAAEHHYIAERHTGATREDLDGPKNGNDQFDQVWKRKDGGYVVIEAKSSIGTELGARNLPNGRRVSQGTRDYFHDIIAEMKKRGEDNPAELRLAGKLERALIAGKLEYVVVKGDKISSTYTGYRARQFDIADRSTP